MLSPTRRCCCKPRDEGSPHPVVLIWAFHGDKTRELANWPACRTKTRKSYEMGCLVVSAANNFSLPPVDSVQH